MNIHDFTKIQHLENSLVEYVINGRGVGGFLRAVLENNLRGAVNRADNGNLPIIAHVVAWLYNNAPVSCWGSEDEVRIWLESGGYVGMTKCSEEWAKTFSDALSASFKEKNNG